MSTSHCSIEGIRFSLAGDEENDRYAVTTISTYESFNDNKPIDGGAYDPLLGTTDHHYKCNSCGNNRKLCPGHPGRLNLKVGAQQPIAVNDTRRWLRIICHSCGTLMIDADKVKSIQRGRRLAEIAKIDTKGKICPNENCKAIHSKIVKDPEDHITFFIEDEMGEQKKLYPWMIQKIFERIPDSTVIKLGRTPSVHPRKFIINIAQVPPVTIRPGVRGFGTGFSGSSYHDITNILQYIIKRNINLPDKLPDIIDPETDRQIQNFQQLLYDMILGSASTSSRQGSSGKRGVITGGKPHKSIMRNLPSKEGRIRRNLLGKRTWNMSRTTISGNSSLKIDYIGYPIEFARTIQIEEVVQQYNIDRLMIYFLNGRHKYPGCTRIRKRTTGGIHEIDSLHHDFRLEIGDTIYRDIIDGDIGLFNRQPSLERSAMGCHKLLVFGDGKSNPTSTHQMNVAACEWYNADFDGDQMNVAPPHTIMARTEASIMCDVKNAFISTKNSGPVNGQVQDTCIGSFELTRDFIRIDKYHAMTIFQTTGIEIPLFDDRADSIFSGRELVSKLLKTLPINYNRKPTWLKEVYAPFIDYNPKEIQTHIVQGELLSGVLDDRSIGAKATGGIFHLISREYGNGKALDMIYALQQLVLQFIYNRGLTVSTGDMMVPQYERDNLNEIISGIVLESNMISDKLIQGDIIPPIGSTTHEFYEQLQRNALTMPDDILGPILRSVCPDSNGLFKMIATGSKGKQPNMIHIMGIIGQITINGERIEDKFAFKRALPYFPRFSLDPAAHGYVKNCYMNGMHSDEFIFSGMNGRFDLINKALSTASTGHQMRKSIMNMQSLVVDNYRRCVVHNKIVQQLYGEDGLDARQVEQVKFKTVMISDKSMTEKYYLDVVETFGESESKHQKLFDNEFEALMEDRSHYRKIFMAFENINISNNSLSDSKLMPVNVQRVVSDTLIRQNINQEPYETENIDELIEKHNMVLDLIERVPYVLLNEEQERLRKNVPEHFAAATTLMKILIRAELCSRNIFELKVASLQFIIDNIRLQYSRALVDYGTSPGILATQAISQPLTQYMLDSHHRSVSGGTNKSGLVRVKEVFGARPVESEQSPEMLIRVLPEFEHDRAKVQEIANRIELMIFERFVDSFAIMFEAYKDLRYPEFKKIDQIMIREFEENFPLIKPPADLTRWCLRFKLDKSNMILKSMSLETIIEKLRSTFPDTFIVHTMENVPVIVIRVFLRLSPLFKRGGDTKDKVIAFMHEMLHIPIRGIRDITHATVSAIIRHKVDEEGSLIRSQNIFGIKTVGTNIYGILMNKMIDPETITTSSIGDTYRMFGIEAARQKLISEIRGLVPGAVIRHPMMYADQMTMTGKVTSFERAGLAAREKKNILLRMAMASPVQTAPEAALADTTGPVYGPNAKLMLGTVPNIGSIYNSVLINKEFVRKNTKSVDAMFDQL